MRRVRSPVHPAWIAAAAASAALLAGAFLAWRQAGRLDFGAVFARGREGSVAIASDDGRGRVAFAFDVDPERAEDLRGPLDDVFAAWADSVTSEAQDDEGAYEDDSAEGDDGSLESDAREAEVPSAPGAGDDDPHDAVAEDEGPTALGVALARLMEAAWNDGIVRWDLAAELPVRLWERPFLRGRFAAFEEGGHGVTETLRSLLARHAEEPETRFLLEEVLRDTVFDVEDPLPGHVHHGLAQFDVESLDTLADALCPLEPGRIDACRLFRLPREETRQRVADLLDALGEPFRVQLHFHWTRRGDAVLVSNTRAGLARLAGEESELGAAEKPAPTAAMLPVRPPSGLSGHGGFVALVRQSHLQNALLALLARVATPLEESAASTREGAVERASRGAGDGAGEEDVPNTADGEPGGFAAWVATPEGDEFRGRIEDAVSLLTRWSSEVLVDCQRRRGGVTARVWYRDPDVTADATDAEARLAQTASIQSDVWLSPWIGQRLSSTVSWPEPSVSLVEATFDGVPVPVQTPTPGVPGPLSRGDDDGPL